ncbi:hypothetical protein [Clostridium manihotivorum]|nr:hypothetical protein [Clostridium manihotivorum]
MVWSAGFTKGGVPYGVFIKDLEVYGENKFNDTREFDDEMPF